MEIGKGRMRRRVVNEIEYIYSSFRLESERFLWIDQFRDQQVIYLVKKKGIH